MIDIEQTLKNLREDLCPKVEVAALYARSHTAHKWKLTFRLIALREGISWRLMDILTQAYTIGRNNMIVGTRILTRSAIETLCLLIYMNKQMESVVTNKISFNDFNELTSRMLLGAKNREDWPISINATGLVKESEKKYRGIEKIYDVLSETAHPNYDGICLGYSKLDWEEYEVEFGNFWEEKYGCRHEATISLCLEIFHEEYNNEWENYFVRLEKWLENNDNKLERQRRKKLKKENI